MKPLEILECTLRDGSYSIDHQFTAEDTAVIAAGLEEAGFRKIEIGHGLGLGASMPQFGVSAATDEEYLEAAASSLTRARFGTFFIPGIANHRHLELAAKYRASFVRIGTNVSETDQGEPFIKHAKELGMEVSCNLMKTYAVPLDEVIRRSERLVGWGADVICIVDSAGGMLPTEVAEMVRRLRSALGVAIGFHGHNNVQLAIANTLMAVDAGASVVDTSLRGMGRSAGNAQTEVLVMLLHRRGMDLGIDPYRTMELGERVAAPIAQGLGVDAIELTCGIALFHSSFLKIIFQVAEQLDIDPKELIVAVSRINKIEVTKELALKVGEELLGRRQKMKQRAPLILNWRHSRRPETTTLSQRTRKIAAEMRSLAMKTGKRTVFTIAPTLGGRGSSTTFPFIRSNSISVIGNADVMTFSDAMEVVRAIDGNVDFILVGTDRPWPNGEDAFAAICQAVQHSDVLPYRDSGALIQAVDAFMSHISPRKRGVVGVVGSGPLEANIALSLATQGWEVRLLSDKSKGVLERARALNLLLDQQLQGRVVAIEDVAELAAGCSILIESTPGQPHVSMALVCALPREAVLVGIGPGSLSEDTVREASARGIRVLRLDMRAGLSGQVMTMIESKDLFEKIMGRGTFGGVPVVAGGEVGELGTVVVDSITNPCKILSIADGKGGLLDDSAAAVYEDRTELVSKEILRRRIEG